MLLFIKVLIIIVLCICFSIYTYILLKRLDESKLLDDFINSYIRIVMIIRNDVKNAIVEPLRALLKRLG